ncbi:MAG TPA: MFS transporter [Patescibacteria group bacterium]|nr:MFS transporter [Patescibacteria group bacterium]
MKKMKYFSDKLSAGFIAIYSGRMTLTVATQLLGLFMPIFLYQVFGFNIVWVLAYYILRDFLYLISLPLGPKIFMNRVGLKNSIRLGVIFGSLFYAGFFILEKYTSSMEVISGEFVPEAWLVTIILTVAVIFTLHRLTYWVPLHTDITEFTSKKDRGKQVSLMAVTQVVLGALMPLAAGWLLMEFSYSFLFVIAILIYFVALIPFSALPKVNEKFSWTYKKTWKEFTSKARRKLMIAYSADGAESGVRLIIWPIFIWELLNGNYLKVGIISSLVVVVTVVAQLIVGKYTDKVSRKKMLKYGTILYSIGWLVKIFIASAFQIFVISAYHNIANIFSRTSFDAINYENAADQGHYVDEYTVLREMAIQVGRITMSVAIILIVPYLSIELTFIFAALAVLAMNFITDSQEIERAKLMRI